MAEQADRHLDYARKELIKAVQEGRSSEALSTFVNDLAKVEAERFVDHLVADDVEAGLTKDKILHHATSYVLSGPNDTWSGRSNDVRRAYYAGLVEAVKTLRYAPLPKDAE